MRIVDYIIVGQGLAGSAIAIQLLTRGKKIVVIDEPENNSSSRVAAGLFNPVTGKKMVKTWMADTVFPYLHNFYSNAEKITGEKFFFPMPLYRPFISVEEQNEWMGRSADPLFVPYIEKIFSAPAFSQVNDSFGGLLLRQCGYLNTTHYVDAVRQWIQKEATLLTEPMRDDELIVNNDRVIYRDIEASKIIFCNGTRSNAWFDWLPIRPLKGETILVRTDFEENIIVNRGVYIVPGSQRGAWRIGATYNFQDKASGITPEARTELEEKLNELMNIQYQCISQEWGFRPTTPDRRPLLGSHPEHPAVIIFNGFGTKGVSLAPYFSDVLIRWMENGIPLNKLVDIERYKSVYWTSPK